MVKIILIAVVVWFFSAIFKNARIIKEKEKEEDNNDKYLDNSTEENDDYEDSMDLPVNLQHLLNINAMEENDDYEDSMNSLSEAVLKTDNSINKPKFEKELKLNDDSTAFVDETNNVEKDISFDSRSLRSVFIYKEIFDKPLSLRDKNSNY